MKILRRILPVLLAAALPLHAAVNRAISIHAPGEATAGSTVSVLVLASTDATDGEQIALLDAEYSPDDGLTWHPLCHSEKSGPEFSGKASFAVNASGRRAIVRVRVAFRGGAAGDVDFRGGAIQWNDSWQKWRWPPAKYATINVTAPPTVNRVVSIEAPTEAVAGSTVWVTVLASTAANDGEQIGFLHCDYSVDDGKTWTQFCYDENLGPEVSRKLRLAVNAKGGKTIVRVRAAFRGGATGDVDYKGAGIRWDDTWQKWRSPPTKYAIIYSPKS